MARSPEPLPIGTVLNERFEVVRVLGRGGFGIVYLVNDRIWRDEAVVKELAPEHTRRLDSTVLDLGDEGPYLRERFLDEARTVGRLNIKGVLPIRAAFMENGTSYFVVEHLAGTETLDQLLKRQKDLSVGAATAIFCQLVDILDQIHAKGLLHRDIKPSNILVGATGQVHLIDFGSAREWQADAAHTQTILFTPGYAPPEQLSERSRRGPATDVYGLAAVFFHMLAGIAPPPSTERMAGAELPDLRLIRPDVGLPTVRAIERGLALRMADRPQTADELRQETLGQEDGTAQSSLLALDERLWRARNFRFGKRTCPVCQSVLVEPKPTRRGVCPVCQRGTIRLRDLHERLCPACAAGTLVRLDNSGPLAVCPKCRLGVLDTRRRSLLNRSLISRCPACEASFEHDEVGMTDESGVAKPYAQWREDSRRTALVWLCDGCGGQFDELADKRLLQVHPKPKGGHRALYPDEWARVAIGLEPDAGNAYCDGCSAEFYADTESITLLTFDIDPFGFGEAYAGRRLSLESTRWLAAGKESPRPGPVCENCRTEFDHEGDYLHLIRSDSPALAPFVDAVRKLEDWHRISQGVPQIGEEDEFERQIEQMLEDAYIRGEIGFGDEATLAFRGTAVRDGDGARGPIVVDLQGITFGGMLRKQRIPLSIITGVRSEGDALVLRLSGERDEVVFDIEPLELTAHLKSSPRTLVVDAGLVARRISAKDVS